VGQLTSIRGALDSLDGSVRNVADQSPATR
jgi:hypothetical protein